MFQFDRQSHRSLSAEIVAALAPIAAKHGLKFESHGGQIGIAEHVLKIRAVSADPAVQQQGAQSEFARSCRHYGLEPQDLGAEFVSQGSRYKLVGIKPSRPKFPLQAECLRSGRTFKFTTAIVNQIVANRASRSAPAPNPVAQQSPVQTSSSPRTPQAMFGQKPPVQPQADPALASNPMFGSF